MKQLIKWYLCVNEEIVDTQVTRDDPEVVTPSWVAGWGAKHGMEPTTYGADWVIFDEDSLPLVVAARPTDGKVLVASVFMGDDGEPQFITDTDADGNPFMYPEDTRQWPRKIRVPKWRR